MRQEAVCSYSACCSYTPLLCPLKSGMCGPVAGLRTPRMQQCVGSCSASTPGDYCTPAGSRNLTDEQEVFDFPSVRPGQRSGWDRQSQVCEREPCQHFTSRRCKQRIFTAWWSLISFGGEQHFKWFIVEIVGEQEVFRTSFFFPVILGQK